MDVRITASLIIVFVCLIIDVLYTCSIDVKVDRLKRELKDIKRRKKKWK